MKKLLGIVVLVSLLSGSAYAKKNDIVIPKYFFANELTKETCSLEGVHDMLQMIGCGNLKSQVIL